MNPINYHRDILLCKKYFKHPYVLECLEMLPHVESGINQVILDGDWKNFSNTIEDYDRFMWEKYYDEPQKTNPINIGQNKKFSSFRELLLYPLWARIKNKLNFESEILLNKSVTQTVYSDGSILTKDVDGGLGIYCDYMGQKILMPILTDEDKGGHFCANQASNVNSIMRKFKDLNPNIFTMATTDNNVTIGKDKDTSYMSSTDLLLLIRGENLKDNKKYSKISGEKFHSVENYIVEQLNQKSITDFTCEKINITNKQTQTIREIVDKQGFLINF